jgi:hypothetical protein
LKRWRAIVPGIVEVSDDLQSIKFSVKTVIPASTFLESWNLERATFNVAVE